QHLLGVLEVGDDTVLHGTDGDDVSRRSSEHLLRLFADRLYLPRLLIYGDDGGLADHDSLSLDVDQGVGGAQIDSQIVRKKTQNRPRAPLHVATSLRILPAASSSLVQSRLRCGYLHPPRCRASADPSILSRGTGHTGQNLHRLRRERGALISVPVSG